MPELWPDRRCSYISLCKTCSAAKQAEQSLPCLDILPFLLLADS